MTSDNFLNDKIFSNHNNSEKIFIETEIDQFTFTDFDKLANKICNVLISLKLKENGRVLDQIDQVKETAIIGVPHKDFGEAVVAIIVASGEKPSEKHVMSLIQNKLAKFKQPKKLFFISELPRNAMGKVQKQVLRNNYKEFFS